MSSSRSRLGELAIVFAAVAALASTILLGVPPASAQTPATLGWTLEPASATGVPTQRSFFDYSLSPGDAIQDFLRLSNTGDHARTFQIYAADAYTTDQGGFALHLRNEGRTGVGAWVSLPFTTRTVAAGTAVTFPFQLGVPHDASPGDWAGGVVAIATDGSTTPSTSGVRIEQGVAARVYVRVRGPLHAALTVTDIRTRTTGGTWAPLGAPGRMTVTYRVVNSGNVRMNGRATIDIADAFGHVVKTIGPRRLPDLLPHESTDVSETWTGLPLFGFRYRTRVVLDAPDIHSVAEATPVWHASTPSFAAVALTIAGVSYLLVHLAHTMSRRRRRHAEQLVPA